MAIHPSWVLVENKKLTKKCLFSRRGSAANITKGSVNVYGKASCDASRIGGVTSF